MSARPLKLGLLLDGFEVPAWLFHSLERIINSDYAEFSLVILNSAAKDNAGGSGRRSWRKNRRQVAYELLSKIDKRVFLRGNDALERMSLHPLLDQVPVMRVEPITDGPRQVLKPGDVESIRKQDLDILIKAGFGQLQGEILSAAQYGLWYYEPDGEGSEWEDLPGFWELVENNPVMVAALSSASQTSPSGWTLYRSSFSTYRFSPARARNISLWAASSFLPRQIERLYRSGRERFFQETVKFNSDLCCCDRKPGSYPTNLDAIGLYTRLLFRDCHEVFQRVIRRESWSLLYDLSEKTPWRFADYQKVNPPRDRFWADPHVIKKDDRYYIFVEEFIYKNGKGHISVIEMDAHGNYSAPVPVLETAYHLSYPFVFEYENQYYLIPESSQNHSIDLYECVEFPTRWKYKLRMLDHIQAVDSTMFFQQGKWWLFTGVTETPGAAPEVELYLFYSADLFSGEWKAHPLNPVVSDVSCARPAGGLFWAGGKLYRPSQDCSKSYGNGFNLNEIVCLSETEYLEKKAAAVKPTWDRRLIGTHTFTCVDGLKIIDGLSRRSRFF